MKAALDTDVIIRFLTGDDAGKQQRARAAFEAAGRGAFELSVPATAVADAVYVLTSPRLYAVERADAAEMLISLFTLPGIELEDSARTLLALELFRSHNLDFGDAYLAACAAELDPPTVMSFDRDFDQIPELQRVEP